MKHLETIFKRFNNNDPTLEQRYHSYQRKNIKKKSEQYTPKSKLHNIFVKNIITSPKVVNIHNTTIKVQNPMNQDLVIRKNKNPHAQNRQKMKWFDEIQGKLPKTDKYISKKRFFFELNKDNSTNLTKAKCDLLKQKSKKVQQQFLKEYRQNYKLSNKNLKKAQSHLKSFSKERKTKTIEYDLHHKNSPKFKRYKTIDNSIQQSQKSTKIITQTINRQIENLDIEFTPEEINWGDLKLPLSPQQILDKYEKYLTKYQKKQILEYNQIYFIGFKAHKFQITDNQNFDNSQGEYKYVIGDHIAFRYEILENIGSGAFGQVIKVFDHKKKSVGALKIIKNKQNYYKQALVELKILKHIKQEDKKNQTNIVKMKDFVLFRKHVCINFELLDISLYEFMKKNKFQGFTLQLIRKFSVQILQALMFLDSHNIIHCDLKPENIVLKQQGKSGIKIIDFGTSCFQMEKFYTYIQSRFYRSPEIVLGIPYNTKIDIWSFGCIVAELYTGYPLFPGECQQQHMNMIINMIGFPSPEYLLTSSRYKIFFTTDFKLKSNLSKYNKKGQQSKTLTQYLQCDDEVFIDFVSKCLKWDAKQRISAREALMHKFIIDGLPGDIKSQHIKQMNSKNPYSLLNDN